jgi:hypothetical protein
MAILHGKICKVNKSFNTNSYYEFWKLIRGILFSRRIKSN